MSSGLCPQCGTPRQGAGRYCASCAYDYWSAAAGATPPNPAAAAAQPSEWNAAQTKQKGWWGRRSLAAKVVIIALVVLVVAALANAPRDGDASGVADATPTARPTGTPRASAEPTVESSPTATPGPAFADVPLSGTGDSIPRFSVPEGAAAIAVVTHTGSSNFAVFSLAADGTNNDLLINTIGNYSGTVLFDEEDGTHSVAFDVTADGAWTITIRPVTAARVWDGTSSLSGTGDDVIQIDPAVTGFATVNITHQGSSNFAVFAYSPSGRELLVNEIGAYSGESLLPDGTFLLQISADGSWAVTPT